MVRGLIAMVILLVVAGCGESSAVVGGRSTAPPYAGPLTGRAAVDALECDGKTPFVRATGDYDDGLASVQRSPERALDDYFEQSGGGYHVPVEGYRVERKDTDRALLSYDVAQRTKVAVVVADGIRDYADDVGWGVVAWAQCDPSELPAAVTEAQDVGVWEDASGHRLPVGRIHSFHGAEHCGWSDIVFLLIGPHERSADWYVRDTGGEFPELLHGSFDGHATLPKGATATGWRRDGRELWLTDDAAYLVDIADPHAVERWPAAKEPILCA
jgi:hypothetical protein